MERQEVFRGHLDECLAHLTKMFFIKHPLNSRESLVAKKPIAEFCGVSVTTVQRWFQGQQGSPVGAVRIKLMCYLDMMDYRVIELENTPINLRNFSELIGFGVIALDEATQLAGFHKRDTLLQVLRMDYGASEEKHQKMWEAWRQKKDLLQVKKEEALKYHLHLEGTASATNGQLVKEPADVVFPEVLPGTLPQDSLPALLVNKRSPMILVKVLLVLLKENLFSEEELASLSREDIEAIGQLSAQVSGLLSQLLTWEKREGGSDG